MKRASRHHQVSRSRQWYCLLAFEPKSMGDSQAFGIANFQMLPVGGRTRSEGQRGFRANKRCYSHNNRCVCTSWEPS